jgi:hypothetical protein
VLEQILTLMLIVFGCQELLGLLQLSIGTDLQQELGYGRMSDGNQIGKYPIKNIHMLERQACFSLMASFGDNPD